jgi:type IV pilus assembly protein PilE
MSRRSRTQGFTLIELMVAIAILGVLMAIAYPSYQEHMRKARRAEAMATLMDGAARLEAYHTRSATYREKAALAAVFATQVPDSGTAYYNVVGESTNDHAFVLKAVPTGVMMDDVCGTFTINQVGVRTAGRNDCWRR